MIVMHGASNSILLHETEGKTVFQTPRRYEVISSSGTLTENGFFAFNNIPVTDEGRPIFEHRFQSRTVQIQRRTWICCFSASSPTKFRYIYRFNTVDRCIVFSNLWKNSPAYKQAAGKHEHEAGLDKMQHIFSSAPYVTTYKTKKDEDEEENVPNYT